MAGLVSEILPQRKCFPTVSMEHPLSWLPLSPGNAIAFLGDLGWDDTQLVPTGIPTVFPLVHLRLFAREQTTACAEMAGMHGHTHMHTHTLRKQLSHTHKLLHIRTHAFSLPTGDCRFSSTKWGPLFLVILKIQKYNTEFSFKLFCHYITSNLLFKIVVAKRGCESDIYISKRGLHSLQLPIVTNRHCLLSHAMSVCQP